MTPERDRRGDQDPPRVADDFSFVDRFAYAVGLGAVILMVLSIPVLVWPHILGKFFNAYLWLAILVVAYVFAPYARRFMKRR